jgi:hypothetical protein
VGGGALRLPPQQPHTGDEDKEAAAVVGMAAMECQWQGRWGQQQQHLLVLLVVFSMLINCKYYYLFCKIIWCDCHIM